MTTALITGIPRSGTSFVCACLNTLPNCVALIEPMGMPRQSDPKLAADEIVQFAYQMRARIVAERTAQSATVDGVIPDNTFEEPKTDGGVRRTQINLTDVVISKPLTDNFRLFIKHPGTFTALAQHLTPQLPLYAIVRHPIAVLASWSSVDIPVREGRWPPAEHYAPDLTKILDQIDDPIGRKVALIRWIFRAYHRLPPERVLIYESIVQDPTAALRPLSGSVNPVTHPVRPKELQSRYTGVNFRALAESLMAIEADVEPYYPNFAATLHPYVSAP